MFGASAMLFVISASASKTYVFESKFIPCICTDLLLSQDDMKLMSLGNFDMLGSNAGRHSEC